MKTKPIGYLFNGKYYKSLDDLRGRTMSEGNTPIPLHSKQQIIDAYEKGALNFVGYYTREEAKKDGVTTSEQYHNQTYKDDE